MTESAAHLPTWRTRLVGLLFAVPIAALMGWLAAPNSMVARDTPDAHMGLATASVLAVIPWAWGLAAGAADRPLRATTRLFVGTYFLGGATLGICSVPVVPLGILEWTPVDGIGWFGSLVPWIAAGAFLWSAGMLLFGSLDRSGPQATRRRIRDQWPARWRLAGAAVLIAMTVAAILGPDLRHIGWSGPVKPEVLRPAHVSGMNLYSDAGDVPYFDLFPTTIRNSSTTCDQVSSYGFVWDEGDSIVLEARPAYGLEIPKAPGFESDATPYFLFSDLVYREAAPCLNDAGQVVFMNVFHPY
jgi:hypothetical protein